MRINLINIDSKIPNLALMKLSAYYKAQGATVTLNQAKGNLNFASCVFSKNRLRALRIVDLFSAQLSGWGSGQDKPLSGDIEHLCPDYSLYAGIDYSIGFTSRGCIRRCDFCIVPQKEGDIREHSPLFEFVRHRKVMLLDNNFLASLLWKDKILEMIDRKLFIDFNQGLDIRLLDEEKAYLLRLLNPPYLRFAFDHPGEEGAVRMGIKLLHQAGYPIDRHRLGFYVLVGFNTSLEEDIYRCELLHSHGINTHVPVYDGAPRITRRLARWANRPWIWTKVKWVEYKPGKAEMLQEKMFFETPQNRDSYI